MGFCERLVAELKEDCRRYQVGNIDWIRFPWPRSRRFLREIKDRVRRPLYRLGLARIRFPDHAPWLRHVQENIAGFERTYGLLDDAESKELLLELSRYRVMGRKHVRLSRNNAEYWRRARKVDDSLLQARRTLAVDFGPAPWCNLYEAAGREGPIRIHNTPRSVLNTFLTEQYAYRRDGKRIAPEPGDVVIDGGGCFGETALWFADRIGGDGHVHSFEFTAASLAIFEKNLALNGHLAPRIDIVRRALWNRSDEALRFETGGGPGTSVVDNQGSEQVRTLTIDDYAKQQRLDRIDFIKLDIEGAELEALKGAEETLRIHRPRLAVCVYHRKPDLVAIPAWLDDLGVGYRLHLKHATIHTEETVLFAAS